MSGGAISHNISRPMTSLNFEIKLVPEHLKCAQCQSVLKDAYQVACGCKFCRVCIDDVMETGGQFCPGGSQECSETSLSTALRDYGANRSILKLTAKCPHPGCSRECPLADMEGHLRLCSRKSVDCPFREFGCPQGALTADEMSSHLQQDSGRHSRILIGMVAGMSRDVEMLKRDLVVKDEQMTHVENENKYTKNELKSTKEENEVIKNENKSIKGEIELIKREKEVLTDRVRQMAETLEREIDERRTGGEHDRARITANAEAVRSHQEALGTQMESVRNNINSINKDIKSINIDIDCIKRHLKSALKVVGLGPVLSTCDEWLIEKDASKAHWYTECSDYFMGGGRRYSCQMVSDNSPGNAKFCILLFLFNFPTDGLLEWPFSCTVTITVAHRDKRKANCRQTRQCRLEKPDLYSYSSTDMFEFSHAELRAAGLELERGMRVTCHIVADEAQ